jgi:hypothetical protein
MLEMFEMSKRLRSQEIKILYISECPSVPKDERIMQYARKLQAISKIQGYERFTRARNIVGQQARM